MAGGTEVILMKYITQYHDIHMGGETGRGQEGGREGGKG